MRSVGVGVKRRLQRTRLIAGFRLPSNDGAVAGFAFRT